MKNFIKYILQKILGFENYLFIFSLFKIRTLKWDKKEKDFFVFLDLLKDDSTALDIGANVGIMTVHLARKLKNGMVYAFEPMPENFSVLKKIVAHYNLKNVALFDFALGNENGEIEMVMPVVNSVRMQGLSHVAKPPLPPIGGNDLTPNPSPENRRGETNAREIRYKVEVKKLDDLSEQTRWLSGDGVRHPIAIGFADPPVPSPENRRKTIPVTRFAVDLTPNPSPKNRRGEMAMKIDVENFEYFVLKGGKNFIRKYKPIIYIELWENENRQKCFEFFAQNGYLIYVVEKGKPVKFEQGKHHSQNFIAIG